MTPWPAEALHISLDLDGPPPGVGDALPPFFHQVYFCQATRPGGLGRDGHPARGDFLPDLGLPRRMWAGGRLEWHAPLRLGVPATRESSIESVTRKQGRSGPLGFVTVRHDIEQDGKLCLTEWQDIVYREDPKPGDPPRPQPPAPKGHRVADLAFDTTLLFRYSALTFNGHRIHYDQDYARGVEGYDNLVVHGPLLAQLLMLAASLDRPLRAFAYRAAFPVTLGREVWIGREGAGFWVEGSGGLHMQGEASWAGDG